MAVVVVEAGDDEDDGAVSVTKGATAAVVLVDGEEDGEVQRVLGVWMVASGCVDGAVAPTGPRGKKNYVKQMRLGELRKKYRKGEGRSGLRATKCSGELHGSGEMRMGSGAAVSGVGRIETARLEEGVQGHL